MRVCAAGVTVEIDGNRIVSDCGLTVLPGEVVGLIGPNGSGKSTLLRCVYRVLRPVAGVVTLEEQDVWALSALECARRTAVVTQESAVEFDFTVREVVLMGRTPHKAMMEPDTRRDRLVVVAALDRVGMSTFGRRSFSSLSGGEKQRVLVARALAQESPLLILDEPTNHLDIRFQLEMLDLLVELGITTLVALHDLNLAATYCDRLYVLAGGRVIGSGPPEEVLDPDLIGTVFGVRAQRTLHPITGRPQLAFTSANGRPARAIQPVE